MDRIDTLIQELTGLLAEVEESISVIGNLQPVTYLSQSKIQFQGGILGGIREYRENKRLEKLINTPIFKDKSYVAYGIFLAETAEKASKILSEIQQILSKEDDRYYGLVVASFAVLKTAQDAWYHYSPDLSAVGVNLRGESERLSDGIRRWINGEYCKLDLPEAMQAMKQPRKPQQESSGCFGTLLLLATAATGLVASLVIIL